MSDQIQARGTIGEAGLERVDILGVGVDVVTAQEAVRRITSFWAGASASGDTGIVSTGFSRRTCHQVVTLNPEMIMAAQADAGLLRILRESSLVVADGIGVVWASRVIGRPLPERVAGVDLASALIGEIARQGRTIAMVGGKPGVADEAARRLRERHPGLRVSVTFHGYFTEAESESIVAQIAGASPDLLLVGLGAPKQERWIYQNLERLNARVAMGVGGALDIFAGTAKRAPVVWQRFGLEWAYRLLREPWRAKRMTALPKFAFAVLRHALTREGRA